MPYRENLTNEATLVTEPSDLLMMRGVLEWLQDHSRYQLDPQRVFAYPVESIPADVREIISQQQAAEININSTFYAEGYHQAVRASGLAIAESLFGLPEQDRERFGALLFPGATISCLQAVDTAIQSAYRAQTGRSFTDDGAVEARDHGFSPVVVYPNGAQFVGEKVKRFQKLGNQSTRYYNLDDHLQPDLISLQEVITSLQPHEQVVAAFFFGGDGTRGIIHRNVSAVKALLQAAGHQPLTIVDASSQGHVIDRTSAVSFRNPDVDWIIYDWQKNGGPYWTSLLLARNASLATAHTTHSLEDTSDLPPLSAAQLYRTGLMSSQGGSTVAALQYFIEAYTPEWLIEKGQRELAIADQLRTDLAHSQYLEPYQSDCRMVTYGVRSEIGVSNWQLAQALNNGTTDQGQLVVGYDPQLRAHSLTQAQAAAPGGEYDGLFGTVTGQHSLADLRLFFSRVETAVQQLQESVYSSRATVTV